MTDFENDLGKLRDDVEQAANRLCPEKNQAVFEIPRGTKMPTSPLTGGGFVIIVRSNMEYFIRLDLRSNDGQTQETQNLFLRQNEQPHILTQIASIHFSEEKLDGFVNKLFQEAGPGDIAEPYHLLAFRRILNLITS